jgi:hypothetical protein
MDKLELPGLKLIRHEGLSYEFTVHGDIGPVLRKLSELPLAGVILPEPRLDEIFINFYKDKADD